MPDRVSLLQKLAAVSIDSASDREALVQVADVVREALNAEKAFLVYAEDTDFLVCPDSHSDEGLNTDQMGLWLISHQIETIGGPVAFDISEERVCNIVPADEADGATYLGFPVGSSEDSGEILVVKTRTSSHRRDPSAFVEAATPAIALVLDHVLGTARAAKQKEQMTALANAAELLTQAENIEPVLEDLATTISNSSGFEVATIDVYDANARTFSISVMNRVPQADTSLGQAWKRQVPQRTYPEAILQAAMNQREPLLFADLQSDERIPEYGREFFRRGHIRSGAQFPITFRNRFLGVLRVASQRPRAFHPREVEVLNGFAGQLAVALEALEMYKSLAESEKQLKRYASELQASMQVQHRLARTDALTGIPNRRYVDEIMKGECSRATRHRTPLSVVLLDVDFFKQVNDTHGHKAGDEALIQLADLSRRSCRRSDVVGRYGGDEFLFILPKADLKAAIRFADRLRNQVASRVFALSAEIDVRMTASAGVADFALGGEEKPSALVKRADEALYEAKAKGRNATVFGASVKRAA